MARYHSSMVNSGRCRSPRSRSRNTRANSKIFCLAGGQQFLAGEFRRSPQIPRRARRRRRRSSSVRGACRWVSLPGETCRMPVSTSAKPCSSNHARTAVVMAPRAARNGLTSACRAGVHHGDGADSLRVVQSFDPCVPRSDRVGPTSAIFRAIQQSTGRPVKRWHRAAKSVCCSPKPLRWPRDTMSGSVPGQNIRKNSFESHRQFYSQGQRHRARRQALRGSDRREHPSRQGNAGQPDRNAPNQRRGEDLRALQDHRPGRKGDHRGPEFQLPLRGRRRLPLHEQRQLRSGPGARGRRRHAPRPICRKT